MSMTDGARSTKGDNIKPLDCFVRGTCPCDSFLRCSTRPPYGQKVWSVRAKRKQACGKIAYNSADPAANMPLLQDIFKNVATSAKRKKYKIKTFYITVSIKEEPNRVMIFPELTELQYKTEMANLNGKMKNAGVFTAFQKSIILRANMVKNGLQLKSDVYLDGSGSVMHDTEDLVPFSSKPLGSEWNIDHVQTRAKGGCNRFCNAGMLSYQANVLAKHDDGLGCPCVDALKQKGARRVGQEEFKYSGKKVKKYDLCNCPDFTSNKNKNAEKLPAKPLGTMDHYKLLCGFDDPAVFIPGKSEQVTKRACSICDSGS